VIYDQGGDRPALARPAPDISERRGQLRCRQHDSPGPQHGERWREHQWLAVLQHPVPTRILNGKHAVPAVADAAVQDVVNAIRQGDKSTSHITSMTTLSTAPIVIRFEARILSGHSVLVAAHNNVD